MYYHNYMLGELFASQVHHALIHAVLPGTNPAGAIYVGNKKAGEFMREKVYAPGLMLDWNQLTRHATGEELNAKAFAEDIASPAPAQTQSSVADALVRRATSCKIPPTTRRASPPAKH